METDEKSWWNAFYIVFQLSPSGLLPWVKLVDNFKAQYSYITNEGHVFTFRSNSDAPRYCLINIDIQKPEPEHWTTLIPQHDQDVMGETEKESLLGYIHFSNQWICASLKCDMTLSVGLWCRVKIPQRFGKTGSLIYEVVVVPQFRTQSLAKHVHPTVRGRSCMSDWRLWNLLYWKEKPHPLWFIFRTLQNQMCGDTHEVRDLSFTLWHQLVMEFFT